MIAKMFNPCLALVGKIDSSVENFVNRSLWYVWIGLFAAALALAQGVLFPSRGKPRTDVDLLTERLTFKMFEMQIAHPFTPINPWSLVADRQDVHEGDFSHMDKIAFRLTIPVLCHALSMGPRGWRIANIVSALFFYPLLARVFARVTGSRLSAVYWVMAFTTTYAGSWFFDDDRFGDGLAWFLLLVAISFENAFVIFAAILLAAFTDERGLIASLAVPLFWFLFGSGAVRPDQDKLTTFDPVLKKDLIAIFLAWLSYLGIRLFLQAYFGLRTGTTMLMDWKIITYNATSSYIPFVPLKIWKGFWLVFPFGLWQLFHSRRMAAGLFYLATLFAVGGTTILVWDIYRSYGYLFPLLIIALGAGKFARRWQLDYARVCLVTGLLWQIYLLRRV